MIYDWYAQDYDKMLKEKEKEKEKKVGAAAMPFLLCVSSYNFFLGFQERSCKEKSNWSRK